MSNGSERVTQLEELAQRAAGILGSALGSLQVLREGGKIWLRITRANLLSGARWESPRGAHYWGPPCCPPRCCLEPYPYAGCSPGCGQNCGQSRREKTSGKRYLPGYRARSSAAVTTKILPREYNTWASGHLAGCARSCFSAKSPWPWKLWSLNFLKG